MFGNVTLMRALTCSSPRLLRCYAVLTKTIDNGFIMSLASTLPWRRHTNLDNHMTVLLLAAMVHSKVMAWPFSFSIYVMTF